MLKLLDKLTPREKKIFAVVVALLMILIIYYGVALPVYHQLTKLDEEIFLLQMQIRKGKVFLRQRESIIEEAQKFPNLEMMEAGTDEEEIARLLNFIEETARKSQVTLSDVKPQQVKSDRMIKNFVVELNTESTVGQLIDYIYQLQHSSELLKIERIDTSSKEENSPTLRSFIVLSRIVVK